MKIIDGWLAEAKKVASPNFNERPAQQKINLLVIHNISLPPAEFGTPYIELFFLNKLPVDAHPYFEHLKGVQVSSHFLIKRDGEVVQFVSCEKRAWHAGESCFDQQADCNDFSLGIELEGTDDTAYTDAQYLSLHQLTDTLQKSYPEITRDRITGHEHISPERKTDPGKSFDWPRYYERIV